MRVFPDTDAAPADPGVRGADVLKVARTEPLTLSVIRKRADFLAANHGLRCVMPGFVLLVNKDTVPAEEARAGITVTRKIGNAVVRNRMKRRFRDLIRQIVPVQGFAGADHILIGREAGVERDFAVLRDELVAALARIRTGKSDRMRNFQGRGRRGASRKTATQPQP